MFTSMAGSLGVVLAAFGGLAWFLRKSNPSRGGHLAANVFEILGRKTLAPRQQAMLVRCGDRILLINLGSHGATTLAEFTDPAEVQRLTQACLSREASAFQESLQQIERKPVSGGFATVNSLFG
jgi:flagellar biogenesis protein FliO